MAVKVNFKMAAAATLDLRELNFDSKMACGVWF